MRQPITLQHQFVRAIPEKLEERTLYVSMDYATVAHKCCCGCGKEVVTPLSPTDWKLTYDGETISLAPSIGNWNFECRSHYWIEKSGVRWAEQWSQERIDLGRARDREIKERQYGTGRASPQSADTMGPGDQACGRSREGGFWSWLRKWWSH